MTEREDAYRRLGKALADVLALALADTTPAEPAVREQDGVRLYRPEQVAERLGLSATSVKALLGRELEVVHLGRAVAVPSDSLDGYIARLRTRERQRIQGEPNDPIDLGGKRRTKAASPAAGCRRAADVRTGSGDGDAVPTGGCLA